MNQWAQHGTPVVVGTCTSFGQSVCLDEDGSAFSASGYPSAGNGSFFVYEWGTLGLDAPEKNEDLDVYPNPAADHVNITGLSGNARIVFTDVSGKIVLAQEIPPTGAIDLSGLTSGQYTATIGTERGTVFRKLLIP